MKANDCLFLLRNGYPEETYFSWSIVPLVGEDGSVVGLYNPAFENTRPHISQRRMLTLREIGDMTAAATEVKSFWGQVIKGLEYNGMVNPFYTGVILCAPVAYLFVYPVTRLRCHLKEVAR